MKKLMILIFIIIIVNNNLAQDSTKTEKTCLKHGLQFQIMNLLSISNFDGYSLSYRYILNKTYGLRVGVFTSVIDENDEGIGIIDTTNYDLSSYNNNYNFKISAQLLSEIMTYKEFSMIIGVGPFISYKNSETNYESMRTNYEYVRQNSHKTIGYGLEVLLGIEYNLSENIVLSAEYGLSAKKENTDYKEREEAKYANPEDNRIVTNDGKNNFFTIYGNIVNIGIAVFF